MHKDTQIINVVFPSHNYMITVDNNRLHFQYSFYLLQSCMYFLNKILESISVALSGPFVCEIKSYLSEGCTAYSVALFCIHIRGR